MSPRDSTPNRSALASAPAGRFEWEKQLRSTPAVPLPTRGVLFMLATWSQTSTGENIRPSIKRLANTLQMDRKNLGRHVEAGVVSGWLAPTGTMPNGVTIYRLTIPAAAAEGDGSEGGGVCTPHPWPSEGGAHTPQGVGPTDPMGGVHTPQGVGSTRPTKSVLKSPLKSPVKSPSQPHPQPLGPSVWDLIDTPTGGSGDSVEGDAEDDAETAASRAAVLAGVVGLSSTGPAEKVEKVEAGVSKVEPQSHTDIRHVEPQPPTEREARWRRSWHDRINREEGLPESA